jgi:hypothetical protein
MAAGPMSFEAIFPHHNDVCRIISLSTVNLDSKTMLLMTEGRRHLRHSHSTNLFLCSSSVATTNKSICVPEDDIFDARTFTMPPSKHKNDKRQQTGVYNVKEDGLDYQHLQEESVPKDGKEYLERFQ